MDILDKLPLIIGLSLIIIGVIFFVVKTQMSEDVLDIEDAMIVFLTTTAFTIFGAIFIALYYIKDNIA